MELNKKTITFLFIALTIVFFIVLSLIMGRRSHTEIVPTVSPSQEPTISRTPTVAVQSQDELLKAQTASDKQFGDWQKKLYDTYPWYDKLPLQTDRYFVYFNPDKKKFIAKLYPDTKQLTPLYEQLNALKTEIRAKLQEFGIPFKEEDIDWIVSTS